MIDPKAMEAEFLAQGRRALGRFDIDGPVALRTSAGTRTLRCYLCLRPWPTPLMAQKNPVALNVYADALLAGRPVEPIVCDACGAGP